MCVCVCFFYIPVCWLSRRTAVRLDLRLLLSSSAFTLGTLRGEAEKGGVRSRAASFSHLPFAPSLPRAHCSHPPSLPFCFPADRLIFSLKPSGRGKIIFSYFFSGDKVRVSSGPMTGKIRRDGCCVCVCVCVPTGGISFFLLLLAVVNTHQSHLLSLKLSKSEQISNLIKRL